ncbi:unnamed protein product [Adineta ricciae]|uniref:Uncharacterized protein n=1 Tax=Adineta ricciae TaxID=249248 RepID=A0A813TEL8_ADIRI|nr:unnamed protein product [Adineta ricciae]CAF1531270.1 unnamed protein product [Adineta ricciae]
MILVLQKNAVPLLEYLYITVEQERLEETKHLRAPRPEVNLSLVHYNEFRQIVNRKHLPRLQQFHFSIRFPGYLYEDLKMITVDKFDATWPFNNLEYHLEVQLAYWYRNYKETGRVILFYTRPLDILLQYTRAAHNHSFARHSTQIKRPYFKWMSNDIGCLTQLTTTFEEDDLCLCSRSNTSVKHLRLLLSRNDRDPNAFINIDHLFQLLPSIRCFETTGRYITFNENLMNFIVKIVETLELGNSHEKLTLFV